MINLGEVDDKIAWLLTKLWYLAFVLAGFAWLVGHYYIERHKPELYIVISAGLMILYGAWGLKRDLKSFAKDAGEAAGELKDIIGGKDE